MTCWSCSLALDPTDHFCKRCGAGQGDHLTWYLKPLWIAVLTPFALGPFAIPLIWKTPKLDKRGRIIGTVLVALFTLWLLKGLMNIITLTQAMMDDQMKGLGL